MAIASASGGGLFDNVTSLITGIGNAASSVLGSWSAIQQKKLDLKLQNAQVNSAINTLKAQQAIAPVPLANVSFPAPNASNNGLSLASIPPWMLLAGMVVAMFTLKGMVK